MGEIRTAKDLAAELAYFGPLLSFPWHPQQWAALSAGTDTVMILGGSQGGKTQSGVGIVSRLVRREGPVYRRLRNPEGRRLKIWVAPQTLEKYESNWEARLRDSVFGGLKAKYVQTPYPLWTLEDGHGGVEVWAKSQDQGFLAFESDVVDLVVFDEEPADRRVVTSAKRGFSTTNGVLVLAFTPLMGVSWTHGAYYVPTVKEEYRVADRVWRRPGITVVQMGMADNPASVAGGGVRRVQEDVGMPESEKRTRLFGEYGYSEGLIFPEFAGLTKESESPYLLETLPDRPWSWVMTCDPNKRHGGLLVGIDHEQNWVVVAEHYAEDLPDRLHAEAYKSIWRGLKLDPNQVAVYADPGGAGGQAIVNLNDCGVYASPVPKDAGSVKASIELIRRMAWTDPGHRHIATGAHGAPHLYFLRSLRSRWEEKGVAYDESRLLWELRQYRQKEKAAPDTPIKQRDDVVDPLRYVGLVRPWGPSAPSVPYQNSEEAETARRWEERVKKLLSPTKLEPNRPWERKRMVPA